ncbi:MAG TPA: polyprenyl synthetase family protein [Anaerolineae bacterium]|nr:polyprenyl synthetase family protein [Anaerolineae bacterium]HNU03029.1 polyprenyl synthetase family protein [Anaerolineae bacterium]
MSSHSDALALVADDMQQVDLKMQATGEVFAPLAGAINLLLASGGKRLRPALALLVSRLYPQAELERVISLAAAVEMLHSATLVHDDVIDGSLLRRGQATLNASWSQGATILAGDFVFARAAFFAAETDNIRVMKIFSQTLMTIVEGELRQLYALRHWSQPRDAYYQRIYGKTAALFAAATEAAAVLGHAPEEQIDLLRDYGYNVGMAFQIMDDILDFVGDPGKVGKPVGGDLRQGAVTLPVFHYLQMHPEALQIMQTSGNGHDSGNLLGQLISDIAQSPAIDATRREAEQFIEAAKACLAPWPPGQHRQALLDLADYVVARSL